MNGVLLGKGQYDWIAGGNSAIKREVYAVDLNWKPYQGEHEIQFVNSKTPYDTLFCVTYSALKCIIALLNFLIKRGLISDENIQWLKDNGYYKNGKLNFSERFSAINGGTTNKGAYQFKVANGIYNFGLIPQDMFPLADNFQDNIDSRFITQEMKDLGKEFIKRFTVNYEWVDSTLEQLKYSPVQEIVRFANYEKPEDILKPEGETNHAVEGVFATPEYDEIQDTYWQVYKRYHPDYTHSYMAFSITVNNNIPMDTEKFIKDNDKKWVRNQNTGEFGRVLRGKLFTIQTTDRAALILLDDRVREDGIQVTNEIWEKLPKENF